MEKMRQFTGPGKTHISCFFSSKGGSFTSMDYLFLEGQVSHRLWLGETGSSTYMGTDNHGSQFLQKKKKKSDRTVKLTSSLKTFKGSLYFPKSIGGMFYIYNNPTNPQKHDIFYGTQFITKTGQKLLRQHNEMLVLKHTKIASLDTSYS